MQDLERLLASPRAFPAKADRRDRILFVPMDEAAYKNSAFLDDRRAGLTGEPMVLTHADVRTALDKAADKNLLGPDCAAYLFHIGHCGSTLISRLLGELDGALALREPVLLQRLAEDRLALGRPDAWVSADRQRDNLDLYVRLLSRRFRDSQAVVIKPTSWVSAIAGNIARRDAETKLVWIGATFRNYAATVLATEYGMVDVLMAAPMQATRLHQLLEGLDRPLYSLTTGEMVAMSWLAEMVAMQRVAEAVGERMRYVDFDDYLEAPAETLARIAAQFGLHAPLEAVDKIANGPLSKSYAKEPQAGRFTKSTRKERLSAGARHFAAELDAGERWLRHVAQDFPEVAAVLDQRY